MTVKLSEVERLQLQNIMLTFDLLTEKERNLEILMSKVEEERAQNAKLFEDFKNKINKKLKKYNMTVESSIINPNTGSVTPAKDEE